MMRSGHGFVGWRYSRRRFLQVGGAGLLSALPVILVFVVLQRQFVEGVASTGIKG